jgi:hypothetical protein
MAHYYIHMHKIESMGNSVLSMYAYNTRMHITHGEAQINYVPEFLHIYQIS